MCDEAETLMHAAGRNEDENEDQGHGQGNSYRKVEIENHPELLERYEIYIPVLKRTDNQQELFWPFGPLELASFLEADK